MKSYKYIGYPRGFKLFRGKDQYKYTIQGGILWEDTIVNIMLKEAAEIVL